MADRAAGVYLAFDGGPDASGPGGPGIGPYEEIVLRGARAVGERTGFGKVIALRSAAGSWRDAESSSSGSDQLDNGEGHLRITGGDGDVLLRFSDDEVVGAAVPDIGPFAAVVIGAYDVRGDGETLAVRVSRISPWLLTDRAGAGFQGAMKEALVFIATGRNQPRQPRQVAATPIPPPAEPAPAAPTADDAEPSVWVDRVKSAPNIYISRPGPKR